VALQDDLSDALAEIRRVTARIEKLERANPLENASITEGPGIRVGTPEGLRGAHKDSVSIEAAEGLKLAVEEAVKIAVERAVKVAVAGGIEVEPTGSIKAGGAQISGANGGHLRGGKTSIGSDGVLRNDDGKIVAQHQIDPLNGVLMTWGGARHSIESVTGWLQGDINSVSTRTTTAQTTANNAASAAAAAQATADSKVSPATMNAALAGKADQKDLDVATARTAALVSKMNTLIAAYNAKHPDAPVSPMS